MSEKIIIANNLTKVYHTQAEDISAVGGVTLDVAHGDFISFMGPSGSGKTTLLDLLGCLTSISSGKLNIFGQDVSNIGENKLVNIRRKRIGFVFQEFLLIPTLTAIENVELPMIFAKGSVDRSHAQSLLEKVGLGSRLNHLPRALSGGERQRVAVARALAASPDLLLADEPTGNLDTKNSLDIIKLFEKLNRDDNLTIVMTTHDESLGKRAKRVIRLQDGKIVEQNPK